MYEVNLNFEVTKNGEPFNVNTLEWFNMEYEDVCLMERHMIDLLVRLNDEGKEKAKTKVKAVKKTK